MDREIARIAGMARVLRGQLRDVGGLLGAVGRAPTLAPANRGFFAVSQFNDWRWEGLSGWLTRHPAVPTAAAELTLQSFSAVGAGNVLGAATDVGQVADFLDAGQGIADAGAACVEYGALGFFVGCQNGQHLSLAVL